MILDDYIDARKGLLAKDLIAFDGARFQVLSSHSSPVYRPSQALGAATKLEDRSGDRAEPSLRPSGQLPPR
jgi:hypothetical protein